MIELTDLKEIRHDCLDVSALRALVNQLLGQPFQFFRVSYGEELRLHLGDLRSYQSPGMRHRLKGSYVVAARASSWSVCSVPRHLLAVSAEQSSQSNDSQNPSNHVDVKTIETGEFIPPGSIVTGVLVDQSACGFCLRLSFSEGSTVTILPEIDAVDPGPEGEASADSSAGIEISDWEILTPFERILRVGRGPRWDYVDLTPTRGE